MQIPKISFYNGHTIPQIGFGTHPLKGNQCIEAVKLALKLGYRLIDTASKYKNEVQIGVAIQQSGIKRKLSPLEAGYQKAINGINQILQRLKLTYIDLILIHFPGVSDVNPSSIQNSTIRKETWRGMLEMKKQGKVKDIGVSSFLIHHLQDLKNSFPGEDGIPVINQFQIHPLLWQGQLIEYCRKNNIVSEVYSPFAIGSPKLFQNQYLTLLGQKYKKTVAQVILRWNIQNKFVTIPKSKTPKYMQQNLDIWDFKLTEQQISNIIKQHDGTRTDWNPHQILY